MRKRPHDSRYRMPLLLAVTPPMLLNRLYSNYWKKVMHLLSGFYLLFLLSSPNAAFGQCNPSGNPTRYEFNVTPTSMLNIIGEEFCTSQSMSNNCCGMQPSYSCLDLVFNLANGPMGEPFGESCQGLVNLMTANGNFDAIYFNVGTPNPMGNATNCTTPINIGNNHTISVLFAGNNMGQIVATFSVTNNMGITIFNTTQIANAGQAVILTICKPGFGCLEDEIIFGCCSASASLALAPAAPAVICAGSSTTLKVTGAGGAPPYTVMMRAASASDTTYFPVLIPDDLDGNSLMDMITTVVSPTETTTYTALSVEDDAGCVQPVMGQSVTVTVNTAATVFAGSDQVICQNQYAGLAAALGGSATGGTWSGGTGVFANASAPITTYTPAPGEYGTTVKLAFTTNNPPGPCPAASDTLLVTINTAPIVSAGKDIMVCLNENLDISKLGATIQANGSGVNTGTWSSSGTGSFQPINTFPEATTYIPSAADRIAGFVTLTLTSADPAGPCTPVSDQAILYFQPSQDMVCNDMVMISLDEDGMVEILPDMILEGDHLDSMFTVKVFVNGVNIGNKVNCSHVGLTLLVQVIDNCTGVFCTATIQVKDFLPPKLVCTDIELICAITDLSPEYLKNVLGIPTAYPVVTENCNQYVLTHKDTWVNLTCTDDYIGYLLRVWTATDASGNKGTCTQYLNFKHQYISDVTFPANITLPCNDGPVNTAPQVTGAPYLTAFGFNFPIFPDPGFCKMSAVYTDQKLQTCDGTYDIIRTWVVYDMCSPTSPTNPKYHLQIIKVIDNTGPVLDCPDDLTVSTDPLNCCATTNLPDMLAEDVCSRIKTARALIEVRHPVTGDILTTHNLNGTLTTFPGNNLADPDTLVVFGFTPCLPPGRHTVTYTVEDDCGNTSSCSYRLTVADQSPPVAACDEITQVSLGIDGMIFVNASTFDDGSYDNCSDVYFKARRQDSSACQPNDQFFDQVKFCCEDINDTVLVIFRVYGVPVPLGPVSLEFEEENSNDCLVQVYIEDKLKPSCLAPAHVTVSCENFDPSLWAYGMATGVDNCCVDTIQTQVNYNQFDTVCNKGTITRTFRIFDCGGQSNQCTQRIIVEYKQDYYVKFPNDVILTVCAGSDYFGEPELFGEDCELLGISYEDELFTVVPDACFKIERTWTIINWCTYDPNLPCIYVPNPNPNAILNHQSNLPGPIVSAPGTPAPWAPTVVKINAGDPAPTNYSIFWSADANCYRYKQIIKITDTQKPTMLCPDSPVEVCDLTTNDAKLWNAPYWLEPATGSHDLCEAPADLCITASDACSGANVNIRYLLFLDLDNDGNMETVVNSANPPDPGTVLFGNAGSPNYLGGTVRVFDERPLPLNQKYRFTIETSEAGFNKIACVRWNTISSPSTYTIPELPYGVHKIKWIVEDGCGNEQVCEYTFVVKDCKPPTITCINGLSVNLMPTGMIMIDVQSFVTDAYDNCTPPGLLIFGIRKAGTGNGFPFNPDGSPQTSVLFDCTELGNNLVEIWAMDLGGNSDYCTTYILVQDNAGICNSPNASVAGMLQTEQGVGLEDVNVQVQGIAPNGQPPLNMLTLSDQSGYYLLAKSVPMAANAVVVPMKDNDPLNGVSTFDLVLINKHILGLAPLNTPYKMIAADANNSRSITTFDIVELRKLILGLYAELPQNTSWRFVDKAYQFPDQFNPFQDIFPETKELANVQSHLMEEDFVAVKTGDVNGSAVPSSLLFTEDRTNGTLYFDLQDRLLKAGEVFTVALLPAEPVAGYQFTLYFPGLEVVDIHPGAGMSADHFAVFPDEHALTTSFNTDAGQPNAGEFSLVFRATSAGKLSQLLSISSRITRAEAYNIESLRDEQDSDEKLEVGLRFNQEGTVTVTGTGFELYQNQPNPWTNTTRVGFHLPENANTTLTVFDETGRVLYSKQGSFAKGYNSIVIDNTLLDETGMLYYKLETDTDSAVRKMIRMR